MQAQLKLWPSQQEINGTQVWQKLTPGQQRKIVKRLARLIVQAVLDRNDPAVLKEKKDE